jgi:hypothetical protein
MNEIACRWRVLAVAGSRCGCRRRLRRADCIGRAGAPATAAAHARHCDADGRVLLDAHATCSLGQPVDAIHDACWHWRLAVPAKREVDPSTGQNAGFFIWAPAELQNRDWAPGRPPRCPAGQPQVL